MKLLVLCLSLLIFAGCKYPDVELCFKFDDEGNCRVFASPDNEGGEWEDTGNEKRMRDYDISISVEDFQKFTRYYQRKCQPIKK